MDWQSADSAPKDGTSILGFFPNFKVGHQIRITYYVISESRMYGKITYSREYWACDTMTLFNDPDPEPTHWMPLPLVPSKRED